MGIRRGSISTPIIADGLILSIDAANRASALPQSNITTVFNTAGDLTISGSVNNEYDMWEGPTTASFAFDTGDYIGLNKSMSELLTSDSPFSLSVWVKFPLAQNLVILGNEDSESNPLEFSTFTDNNFMTLSLNSTNSTVYVGSIFQNPVINKWWNLVWVLEIIGSTKTYKAYVNGQFGGSNSISTSYTLPTSDSIIGDGKTFGGSGGDLNIANLQLYNIALNSNYVLHNYNALKGRFGL